jgi:hypothetical protein
MSLSMHQIPEEMTGAGSKTVYSEFQKCIILYGIRIASTVAGVYCCGY